MNYFDMKWRLSACRVNAGYSQVEVARILGVSEQTMISWEAGRTAPKMEYAQILSELYFIPLAYMDFSKEGNSTPIRERVKDLYGEVQAGKSAGEWADNPTLREAT